MINQKIQDFAASLGIEPTGVSKRLTFIKQSELDDVWHIADYELLVEAPARDKVPFIMTLHGQYLPLHVKADSLTSVALRETREIKFCEFCLSEFVNALDLIQANPQTQFVAFEKVLEESRSSEQIGAAKKEN